MTTHAQAHAERWPTADEVEHEVYQLSFSERQRLRQAVSQARKAAVDAERERQRNACACSVCLGHQPGTHGEALYLKRGCKCAVCRNARNVAERRRKRGRALKAAA